MPEPVNVIWLRKFNAELDMLTLEDCIALSDLTEDEVLAIAEHEHLPEMLAVELGNYLIHSPNGVPLLKRMILDDIEAAQGRGDLEHAFKLRLVLRHFIRTHPDFSPENDASPSH